MEINFPSRKDPVHDKDHVNRIKKHHNRKNGHRKRVCPDLADLLGIFIGVLV